jgi:two-component system, NtrC family, response regulator AtoC
VTETEIAVARLLVVSRDPAILRSLHSLAQSSSWRVEIAASPWEAMDRIHSGAAIDLVLVELPQGDADGLRILRWLRRLRRALPIVVIGHPDDVERKQESIRVGARDYLVRPFTERQLQVAVQRTLAATSEVAELEIASEDVETVGDGTFFIGASPVMHNLRAQLALQAEASLPVLILGESGSGKETAARLLHKLSLRSGFEFARVNCAALPEDLLERELFGFESTGDDALPRIRRGKMEVCTKGTIFLDEVAELPLALQSRLLQVLESGRLIRPGSSEFIEVDVRILAASSTSLELAVSQNRFHADLYRHLSACQILVPPLRERKEEIPFLARHFMHRLARQYGVPPRNFSPAIGDAWASYEWPGNLLELENLVKRYLLVGDKELESHNNGFAPDGGVADVARNVAVHQSHPESFPDPVRTGESGAQSLRSLVQSIKSETEKNAIAMALEKTGWNRKAAARLLNVSYRTVLYKIEQYQLTLSNSSLPPASNRPKTPSGGFRSGEFDSRAGDERFENRLRHLQ